MYTAIAVISFLVGMYITYTSKAKLTRFGRITLPFLWPILPIYIVFAYTLLGIFVCVGWLGKGMSKAFFGKSNNLHIR